MKALKLTNSINILLNEDKFSKYTPKQVYDELGEDNFVNYIEQICTKVIRGYPNFKTTTADMSPPSNPSVMHFFPTYKGEEFIISWVTKNKTIWYIEVIYRTKLIGGKTVSDKRTINSEGEVNIASLLKAAIGATYEHVQTYMR